MTILDIHDEIARLTQAIEAAEKAGDSVEVRRLQAEKTRLEQLLCASEELLDDPSCNLSGNFSSLEEMLARYRAELGIQDENCPDLQIVEGGVPCNPLNNSSYQQLVTLLTEFKNHQSTVDNLGEQVAQLAENLLPEEASEVVTEECPLDYYQVLLNPADQTAIQDFYQKLLNLKTDLEQQI